MISIDKLVQACNFWYQFVSTMKSLILNIFISYVSMILIFLLSSSECTALFLQIFYIWFSEHEFSKLQSWLLVCHLNTAFVTIFSWAIDHILQQLIETLLATFPKIYADLLKVKSFAFIWLCTFHKYVLWIYITYEDLIILIVSKKHKKLKFNPTLVISAVKLNPIIFSIKFNPINQLPCAYHGPQLLEFCTVEHHCQKIPP